MARSWDAISLRSIGLIAGAVAFVVILSLPPLETFRSTAQALSAEASGAVPAPALASSMQCVLALLLLMVIWWVTEAIPLPATALLPAIVLPLLRVVGVSHGKASESTMKEVLLGYANPVIYLFLGGFLLAAAMQKWRLDRRLTLWLLSRGSLAENPRSVLLGVMGVTAFLSMWISNTATAAMMLPLGLGILGWMGLKPGESRYGTALMLGIAWAASIGGVGTIIGTPPNGIALGILNSTLGSDPSYRHITFFGWLKFGVPFVVILVPVAWRVLLAMNPPEIGALPGGKARVLQERASLGPVSAGERWTIVAFVAAVALWISNPFWPVLFPAPLASALSWVDEYLIGLLIGVSLFIIPVNARKGEFLLEWSDTKFVDWGTLVLFGGGIALSDAMFRTGLATWIASTSIGLLGNPPMILMMAGVVFLMAMLTEVTSNTAVTGMMVPVVLSIALRTGRDPVTLSVAAAVASSLAFMLPVATPPNALVYGTRYVTLPQMVKSGIVLEILGWLITVGILAAVLGV